ncbi:MAG TPA: hypothetical protein VGH10_05175 [Actinomycetota bacterium]|jgi:hypothetical protein
MRRSLRLLAVSCLALAALALAAGPAGASPAAARAGSGLHAVDLNGHTYLVQTHGRFGVKPIRATAAPAAGGTLSVQTNGRRGVVSPTPTVYLVFWGNQWSNDPAGAEPALQAFFTGLFGSVDTWGTIMNQYCEGVPAGTKTCGTHGIHIAHPTATPLAGVWMDNAARAPGNATQAQIAAEAVAAAQHFGNTTQTSNLNSQYVIASAHGTHPDGFPNTGFCAWHDFTSSSFGNLAYTNLPYVADLGTGACTTIAGGNLLDGYFSTETHEYAESNTDLWPARGWLGAGGEVADECIQLDSYLTLSTGTFDVQGLWSNDRNKCATHEAA